MAPFALALGLAAALAPQDARTQAASTLERSPPPTLPSLRLADAYPSLGRYVGGSGLVARSGPGGVEVYGGGSDGGAAESHWWWALRWSAARGEFEPRFVSPYFSPGIRRLVAGDLHPASGEEVAVLLRDGRLLVYERASLDLIDDLDTGVSSANALVLADLVPGGLLELALLTDDRLEIRTGTGGTLWGLTGVGGVDLAVGQMDADPALELATTSGYVIDATTRAVQWSGVTPLAAHLAATDLDGDGLEELIACEPVGACHAYDVDLQQVAWSLPVGRVEALRAADVDGDGHDELFLAQRSSGELLAYDPAGPSLNWTLANPALGATAIEVADVDGDGTGEVLFGAAGSHWGDHHLGVAAWAPAALLWQSPEHHGGFVGPELGDVDGDGEDELVVLSLRSANGGNGRLLVFDARTLELEGLSPPTGVSIDTAQTADLHLADVDGDPEPEVLVATWLWIHGVLEAWDVVPGGGFALAWQPAVTPLFGSFTAVDAGDVDGDGEIELIAGTLGAPDVLWVFDRATGGVEWQLATLGQAGVRDLEGVDLAGDGVEEVVVLLDDGTLHVVEGLAQASVASFPGSFRSLRVLQRGSAPPWVLAGDANGGITVLRSGPGGYLTSPLVGVPVAPLEGFEPLDVQSLLASDLAGLHLIQPLFGGGTVAGAFGYGELGRRSVRVPGRGRFVTTCPYGVLAFERP